MATQKSELDTGSGPNLGGISVLLNTLFGKGKDTSKETTTSSGGDLTALNQIFAAMKPGTTAKGNEDLIQQIFKMGMEADMPTIFGASNATGGRGGSTGELLKNDLASRLAGKALETLRENQIAAGNVAANIAHEGARTTTKKATAENKGILGGGDQAMNLALGAGAAFLNSLFGAKDKQGNWAALPPDVYNTPRPGVTKKGTNYGEDTLDPTGTNTGGGMNVSFLDPSATLLDSLFPGTQLSSTAASSLLDTSGAISGKQGTDPLIAYYSKMIAANPDLWSGQTPESMIANDMKFYDISRDQLAAKRGASTTGGSGGSNDISGNQGQIGDIGVAPGGGGSSGTGSGSDQVIIGSIFG
jgi:hypothetical protein